MFDTLKHQLFKFLLPTLFLIFGLYLLGMVVNPTVVVLNNGVEKEIPQNMQFTIASLFFIAASLVWFLYLLGVINTMIGYVLMGVMLIISVFVLYTSYDNISSTVQFNTDFAQKEADIKVRLDDIKQEQLAYKKYY